MLPHNNNNNISLLQPILAHAYERKIVCRVAGNKETFAGWQAGGRAEGCARDTGGGRPWPLQQMLDRSAATATAGRVLLRLDYTLTRILHVYYNIYVCVSHRNLHTYKRRPRAQCTMHLPRRRRRCSCCIIFIITLYIRT